MRLARVKVWRAFRELDPIPDEECLRYIRRVRIMMPTWRRLLPVPAGILGAAAWIALCWSIERSVPVLGWIHDRSYYVAAVGASVWIGGAVLAAGLAGLAVRDGLLLLALREEIHRARCPKCKQSFAGLPIRYQSLNPQQPGDARVRCPECGREWVLLDIGLTVRDLVPFEQRAMPSDVAKMRPRRERWGGRGE